MNTEHTTNNFDMLAVFDNIEINNEEKISEADREFCKEQQRLLYASLDQIDKWYNFFKAEAEKYTESHRVIFEKNGSVKTNKPYVAYQEYPLDYTAFEYEPFEQIDNLVKARRKAVCRFSNAIIDYFNNSYNLKVDYLEYEKDKLSVSFRPEYITAVNAVIEHLGGCSFREKSEEELISRFYRNIVKDYRRHPELKGDKIIFYDVIQFDDYWYKQSKRLQIHYNYTEQLDGLCEAIAFAGSNRLNCNRIIRMFDSNDVNGNEPYHLIAGEAKQMKFYRNGRIDVIFSSKSTAFDAYKKLKLNNRQNSKS